MSPNIIYRSPIKNIHPKIIYLLRHGESEGNARGLDDFSLKNVPNHQFPLTQLGFNQINHSAEYILNEGLIDEYTGLYTSNFLRAKQSLEIVLKKQKRKKFDVVIDPRLDEWWKGIFHSLSPNEIAEKYPLEADVQAREGWHHYRPPQGQAGKDVEKDLISFFQEVKEDKILIVGHGRNLGFMFRLLADQLINLQCLYPIPKNGEIWKLTKNSDINKYNFESLFTP